MKKTLLATTALVAGFAGAANAVDVEFYGQVNKVLMFVDDGVETDFSVADNDVSSTRFGMKGSQALDNGLTASVLLEGEMQDNASNSVTQNVSVANSAQNNSTAAQDPAASSWSTRHARVGLAGDFGAVFVGRQSTASDSVTEQDLAGVGDLMYSSMAGIGGGYVIRAKTGSSVSNSIAMITTSGSGSGTFATSNCTGTGTCTISNGLTTGALATNMDGNGRGNALRYDSPIFNGFQGRASIVQGGDMDLAAYYAGKYDAFEINAALGYVMYNDQSTITNNRVETQTSGSVSVKHDSGVAATFAAGSQSIDDQDKTANNEDPSFAYFKLGYAWDQFEVAADYGDYDNTIAAVTDKHSLTGMGLAAQYNLGSGVSVGALYRTFEAEVKNTAGAEIDTHDQDIYAMSLRVKF